jgi:hypothetical protein
MARLHPGPPTAPPPPGPRDRAGSCRPGRRLRCGRARRGPGRQLQDRREGGIHRIHGDREDLVVLLPPVQHPEHPHGTHAEHGAGKHRGTGQHQHIQRIAVVRQRAGEDPVVRRVGHGHGQEPVHLHAPRGLVELVLDGTPRRNLHEARSSSGAVAGWARPARGPGDTTAADTAPAPAPVRLA